MSNAPSSVLVRRRTRRVRLPPHRLVYDAPGRQVNACYREGAFQARSQVPMSGTEGTATANFKFVSSAATQAPARNIRI